MIHAVIAIKLPVKELATLLTWQEGRGAGQPRWDVKQSAWTLVCHKLVEQVHKSRKSAGQGRHAHCQLADQDHKKRKFALNPFTAICVMQIVKPSYQS